MTAVRFSFRSISTTSLFSFTCSREEQEEKEVQKEEEDDDSSDSSSWHECGLCAVTMLPLYVPSAGLPKATCHRRRRFDCVFVSAMEEG